MQILWALLTYSAVRFAVAYLNYHDVLGGTAFLYGFGVGAVYVFVLMVLARRDRP